MKKRFSFCLLVFFPFLGIAQQLSTTHYKEEIANHRTHEDSLFKFGEKSPLAAEAKISFQGLNYFPVEEAYRVKAKFVRTAQETIFKMPTTGTRTPEYVKYGELHFKLKDQPLRLNVYQNQELIKQPHYLNYLFIPFTDATTGQETYATGRYLDFSIPMGTDSVWLDFNKAYNPYCAYSDGYSCPIPPKENKLPVRIEAGVKTYEKKESSKEEVPADSIEIKPEFPGGQQAMLRYLSDNFKLPPDAVRKGVTGIVVTSFIIGADGRVGDIKIIKPLFPSIDLEMVRMVRRMPV